ncbi:MAG: penicillin-binding protein activator [Gammaproteobacteria bacterium]|nr:penicillin-binding protein activator [Gammaproteobacteria bacterium]
MNPTLAQLAVGLLLVGNLLTACHTAPTGRPEIAAPSSETAQRAEAGGEHLIAAREYRRLAERAAPPLRQHFEIKAVESLAKAGQVREARELLPRINVAGLDANLSARKRIVDARVAALEGRPDQTIVLLNQVERTHNIDPMLLAEAFRARAQAEASLERPFDAVKSLVEREKHLVVKAELAQNQQQIWLLLQSVNRAALADAAHASRDPLVRGWLELAQRVDPASGPASAGAAIEDWKKTHPGHPAGEFVKTLAVPAPAIASIGRIERIALLLPLTSEHALAAQAVRDGFLAMHAASSRPDKPAVKVYDIGANPAQAPLTYSAAVRDGAQLVVGPLGLEAVDQVIKRGVLEVPTLLLSHAGQEPQCRGTQGCAGAAAGQNVPGRAVFQFGLPAEQEAVQAAERAYLDGHRQAASLTANTASGQRLARAFADAWQRLGGLVVSAQTYPPDQNDYADPVKRLLNIDQSEARKNAVEARLKIKLKFEPHPRDDVDFIFLGADAKHARLIKPQISYNRAARLPVYATSHVFTGRGDPGLDADLDGIMFGDMPWILVGDGKIQQLRETLQRDWPYARSPLDRLYALGVDAYAVIPWLNRMGADSGVRFDGVTSGLSLDPDGRLHRQLVWARFKKGVPQLLDTFFKHKGQFQTDDGIEDPFAFSPGT